MTDLYESPRRSDTKRREVVDAAYPLNQGREPLEIVWIAGEYVIGTCGRNRDHACINDVYRSGTPAQLAGRSGQGGIERYLLATRENLRHSRLTRTSPHLSDDGCGHGQNNAATGHELPPDEEGAVIAVRSNQRARVERHSHARSAKTSSSSLISPWFLS